jgi:D-lactate dehydrogenase
MYKPTQESDIISLHLPLLPETYHIINKESLVKMKKGVVIINVSRGALVDTIAVEGQV